MVPFSMKFSKTASMAAVIKLEIFKFRAALERYF